MTPICFLTSVMVYPMLIPGCFIMVTLLVFICLAKWTPLLREEITDNEEFHNNHKQLEIKLGRPLSHEYPFSLSKVQLGVWTMVISSSYIYLSLFKGDCAETDINKTALVLLGIFSGTAVTAKIIDKRELKDQRLRHQNTPSRGFFTDILSDDAGISIHRFQHVAWTLVGILIYIYKISEIKTGCVLPELSDTLLTLMGISSATFVAIRSKENDPEAAQKTNDADNRSIPAPLPATEPYQPPKMVTTPSSHEKIGGNDFYG